MTSTGRDSGTRNLARAFAALVCATYALIVLGALVRAHGAGLACPDWPLCFGEFVPRFDLKVAFEWSHRLSASIIALTFAILAALAWRNSDRRQLIGPLLWIAAALLALQVLFGALTVWQLLAAWSVTSHLLTGNAFAACLVLIAARLFDQSSATRREGATPTVGMRTALTLAAALLVAQIALGGLVASRYAGLVCEEWPTCTDGQWFPSLAGAFGLQIAHRLNAYALVLALGVCAVLERAPTRLGRLLRLALALVVAQVGVGAANVLLRLPIEVTGAHSGLAGATIAVVTLALREAWQSGSAVRSDAPRELATPRPVGLTS